MGSGLRQLTQTVTGSLISPGGVKTLSVMSDVKASVMLLHQKSYLESYRRLMIIIVYVLDYAQYNMLAKIEQISLKTAKLM